MPVSFSASNELAFTNGDKVFFYDFMSQNLKRMNSEIESHKNGAVESEEVYPPDSSHEDISDLICKRINHGYGLDLHKNVEVSKNFSHQGISIVWRWLQIVERLVKGPKRNTSNLDFEDCYMGVAYLFNKEANSQNIPEDPEMPEN